MKNLVFFLISGEEIGIEYLYSQTGKVLQDEEVDPEVLDATNEQTDHAEEDEGFQDRQEDPTVPLVLEETLAVEPARVAPELPTYRPVLPIHEDETIPCE